MKSPIPPMSWIIEGIAMAELLYIFCYDIKSSKIRNRVSHILEEHGVRVQKSIFEGMMTGQKARILARRLNYELMDGDMLRYYALDEDMREKSGQYGGSPLLDRDGYYLL